MFVPSKLQMSAMNRRCRATGCVVAKTTTALVIAAVALLPRMGASAQSPSSEPIDVLAIPRAVETFRRNNPAMVGLSIGLVKDGRRATFHFGVTDRRVGRAPDDRSIYPIGSITKTFTGALLAQASLDRRLGLDDDVRTYLDGNYPNLEVAERPIRLVDLITHRSGLPFNLPDVAENRPPFPTPVAADVQGRIARYDRESFLADLHDVALSATPGETFGYSNAGAVLLSLVLEKAYGVPYEELIRRTITGPLGMPDTVIALNDEQRVRRATGHSPSGEVTADGLGLMLGAGALKSTVLDLLTYATWQIDESHPAVRLSHQPVFGSGNFSVGLNWQMMRASGYRRIWQEGIVPGYMAVCVVVPELKIGLVVLANQEDREASTALNALTRDILTAIEPRSAPLF